LGIVLGDNIDGDYSTLAQVRDPDGNLLTLATPPSRLSTRNQVPLRGRIARLECLGFFRVFG
jgi:hypothetical protein